MTASSWQQLFYEPHVNLWQRSTGRPWRWGSPDEAARRRESNTRCIKQESNSSLCCFFCLLIQVHDILLTHANEAFKVWAVITASTCPIPYILYPLPYQTADMLSLHLAGKNSEAFCCLGARYFLQELLETKPELKESECTLKWAKDQWWFKEDICFLHLQKCLSKNFPVITYWFVEYR